MKNAIQKKKVKKIKPTKAVTVEMLKELQVRRHAMEYAPKPEIGSQRATGLLKKIIEFEKEGYYVPPEYGKAVFYYKETIGNFLKTSYLSPDWNTF